MQPGVRTCGGCLQSGRRPQDLDWSMKDRNGPIKGEQHRRSHLEGFTSQRTTDAWIFVWKSMEHDKQSGKFAQERGPGIC